MGQAWYLYQYPQPSLLPNYQATEEAVDYFEKTVSLFQILPSYSWLQASGIVPSSTATYTSSAILSALQAHFSYPVTIRCNSNNELNEIWYHYVVQGSVSSGTFHKANPVGSGSNCPSSGVKYIPKSGGGSGGGGVASAYCQHPSRVTTVSVAYA